MSWFTAGEIALWLLLAAVLGFVLGWVLRGVLWRIGRRRDDDEPIETFEVSGTRISDVDTET